MSQQMVFETQVAKGEFGVEYVVRVFYIPRGEYPYRIKIFKRVPGMSNFFSAIDGQIYEERDRRDAEQYAEDLLEHAVNERL